MKKLIETRKLKTVQDWLTELKKETISKKPTDKEAICALAVAGAFCVGPFKVKVYGWLKSEYPLKQHYQLFNSAWSNLCKGGVIKNGKIHVDPKTNDETKYIEFCLFIAVAEGYLKRSEKSK